MPPNVTRFEQLMYLSLGIGIINAALQYQDLSAQAGFTLFVQAFVLGISILFIWLIARRHTNWARWVLLIIFLPGVVAYIPLLSGMLQTNLLSGILSIIQFFFQGIALYLVFTGNSGAWFKKHDLGSATPDK